MSSCTVMTQFSCGKFLSSSVVCVNRAYHGMQRVALFIKPIIVFTGRPGNRGSIPVRVRIFLFPIASEPASGPRAHTSS